MNLQLLQQMIAAGYITIQQHPHAPLYIYNYSQAAQYEEVWNEVTLQCRGLILDDQYKKIAQPFPKFFNLEEKINKQLPSTTFDVYEKMDGSLGILYWWKNMPYMATRGSFTSDQAIKATEILHQNYAHTFTQLNKSKTYLFEIIYPENRIVLDYGSLEDIILLAIIDTATGQDEPLVDIGFNIVKKYDGLKDIYSLKQLEQDNKEGFVIKFNNGYRVKVKFAEYIRLHKIITAISNKTIWEFLKDDLPFDELLEKVPDEFFNWVKKTKADLQNQFCQIENTCKKDFKILDTKKETALYYLSCQYPKVLFLMHDNKNYNEVIWKMIKPKYSKPFNEEKE
jgi:hypothetical protein